jgi:hypothetical protein
MGIHILRECQIRTFLQKLCSSQRLDDCEHEAASIASCNLYGNIYMDVLFVLGLILFLSFETGIKKIIYDSNFYLFGCQEIGYKIYLEFHGFSSHA